MYVLRLLRQFKTCHSLKLSSYKIDLVISDLMLMFMFSCPRPRWSWGRSSLGHGVVYLALSVPGGWGNLRLSRDSWYIKLDQWWWRSKDSRSRRGRRTSSWLFFRYKVHGPLIFPRTTERAQNSSPSWI